MVKARKFVLHKVFDGEPKPSDFKIVEEELPALKDGQILCEAVWLSVDPFSRVYTMTMEAGVTIPGGAVARVVQSKAADFPVGRHIVGHFGWRDKTVYDTKQPQTGVFPKPFLLPDFGSLPLSLGVGALGMPGVTANHAFLAICDPQPGETVVVNAAAGAVGSLVGQIAKIKGCRVVGFAGSDDKVKWLTDKLGFDAAFNYKKVKIADALAQAAPKGVDCYFDNVGGAFSNEVFSKMNLRGRVTVCGAIAGYNEGFENILVPMVQPDILMKELKVQGYFIWYHFDKWMSSIKENMKWIKEGKLQYEETITEGFENTPKAFIGLLRGENTGKAVVKM